MLETFAASIKDFVLLLRIQDVFDILIVAFIVYKSLQLIKETRAEPLLKGIIVLLVVLQLSEWFQLYTINYILKNTMQIGVLAIVVLFRPELRRGLEHVGRSSIGQMFLAGTNPEYSPENVSAEICRAVSSFASARTGALIVLERQVKIGDIIGTGVLLNSAVSAELLSNIFTPNTPLHDGAVVIRNNQIVAAACLLPLTPNQDLSIELGTRHRAALGISETTDSVVIIVSEETGKISVAMGSKLTRNLNAESLQKTLNKILLPEGSKNVKKGILLNRGQKR